MSEIEQGSRVLARTAENAWVRLRAASGVTDGVDFPVVWLLEEERWQKALADGDTSEALPFPAEDVRPDAVDAANDLESAGSDA